MQQSENVPFTPPETPKVLPAAWFALGSVFGAVILFCVLVILTRGSIMDSLVGSTELEATRIGVIRQAARDGVADALAASGPKSPASSVSVAGPPVPQAPPTAQAQQIVIRQANVQGNPNAPVQIVEFGDFGCIFCTRFYQQTLSRIIDKYVKTGQANLVYKHFPIVSLHPGADLAAVASECAADQGKFWEFHNVLFERNTKGFTSVTLAQMALDLQLDVPNFTSCLNNGTTSSRMTADMAEGRSLNVGGTPTFYINGQAVVGAQPYEVFDRAISQALAKRQ